MKHSESCVFYSIPRPSEEIVPCYDVLYGNFYKAFQDFLFDYFGNFHLYDGQQGNVKIRNEHIFEVITSFEFFLKYCKCVQDCSGDEVKRFLSFLYSKLFVPDDFLTDFWFGSRIFVSNTKWLLGNTQNALQYRKLKASLYGKVAPNNLLISTTLHLIIMANAAVKKVFDHLEVD